MTYYSAMETKAAYEELLWLIRLQNPEVRDAFNGDFGKVLSHFSTNTRLTGSRKMGMATTAKVTNELKRSKPTGDLMTMVRRLTAATLLESAFHNYAPNQAPKQHHWIPLCYLTRFTRSYPQPIKRGAHIPTLDYSIGMVDKITRDRSFIHPVKKSKGFYELSAEHFFSVVESRYSNALLRVESAKPRLSDFDMASFVSMLLIQTLRAPHPSQKSFNLRTLADFAKAAAELLDSIEAGYAYIVPSEEPLAFVPYAPTRKRIFVSGKQAWYFPVTSNLALVLSEERMTQAQQKRVTEGARISTVKWAQRNHEPLFGFGSYDLAR